MKLRIADRILVALAGLLLLVLCAGMIAQMFFQVNVMALIAEPFSSDRIEVRAALVGFAAVLLLLGIYCVFVLFRHRKRKDKFILQKNDSGELAISIKALESMVQKCLDQHDEMKVQHLYLENKKDGLLIRIRGAVAGGISIPLTVEALQKQIKQYVTACSGVEVKGIRVQIENSGQDAENAPFAIEAPAATPLLKESENKQMDNPSSENKAPSPASEESSTASQASSAEADLALEENDNRPLHQRLFSPTPEPCIVPEPPATSEQAEQSYSFDPDAGDSVVTDPETMPEKSEAVSPAQPEQNDDTQEPVSSALSEGLSAEDRASLLTEAEGKADPVFRESLKAFDDLITGDNKE